MTEKQRRKRRTKKPSRGDIALSVKRLAGLSTNRKNSYFTRRELAELQILLSRKVLINASREQRIIE